MQIEQIELDPQCRDNTHQGFAARAAIDVCRRSHSQTAVRADGTESLCGGGALPRTPWHEAVEHCGAGGVQAAVEHLPITMRRCGRCLGTAARDMISISTRQTLVDNIAILSPELLDAINKLAVQAGHRICGVEADAPLHTRCDLLVVESNVPKELFC